MGIRSELFWKVNVIRESVCELDQFFSPRDVADTVANVFVDVFANALTTSIGWDVQETCLCDVGGH